jgi:phage baseplate assembly protein W
MASKEQITVKVPLTKSGKNIGFETLSEDQLKDVVKFNIKNIILTNPGERVWDPDFGSGIMSLLFEQATPSLISDVTSRIRAQLRVYAPYVTLIDLKVEYREEHVFLVSLKYEISIDETIDTMEIEIADNLI